MSERLIEATHRLRLSAAAHDLIAEAEAEARADGCSDRVDPVSPEERQLALAAIAACAAIERSVDNSEADVLATATNVVATARLTTQQHDRQNHTLSIRVASVANAELIADALAAEGFERWETWSGAALRSFRRFGDRLTMARTGSHTLVVRVIWADAAPTAGSASPRVSRVRGIVHRIVTPTAGDWDLVALPEWAWRGYSVVRPMRQLAERIGLRRRHEASLGPFLATPDCLLAPLFEFADVHASDTVVDLGCGDGRIPVAAARQFGCSARGVEQSAELVGRAQARIEEAGVADLVDVVAGDARTADLGDVDVVFMFLPADVVAVLLPDVLERLRPGARIVMHEQSRPLVSATCAPQLSRLIVADGAVTIAHRWDAV